MLAGELDRRNLALGTALAETARNQDAVDLLEMVDGVLALEDLRIDPVEVDLDVVGDAAVGQRLAQRLVGVQQAGVLADNGDGHLAFRLGHTPDHLLPARQVRLRRLEAEMASTCSSRPSS